MYRTLPYNLTEHDLSRIKAAGFNVDIEAREMASSDGGFQHLSDIDSFTPVVTITRYVCGQPVEVEVPLIYLAKLLNKIPA